MPEDNMGNRLESAPISKVHSTRLQGNSLITARATWFVVYSLAVILAIAGLYHLISQDPADTLIKYYGDFDRRPVQAQIDHSQYFSVPQFILRELLYICAYAAITFVIFWRKSNDWMGLFVSASLMAFATAQFIPVHILRTETEWSHLARLNWAIGEVSALILLYLFPDGRFVPGWTRRLAIVWAIWQPARIFLPASAINPYIYSPLIGVAWSLGWLGTGILAQVIRYRRVSSPLQRQQTKWVVLGLAAGAIGYGVFGGLRLAPNLFSSYLDLTIGQSLRLYFWVVLPGYTLTQLIWPLALALAILRYHLWEIDVIIRRTLVYGVGSATLALVYFVSVVVLQQISRAISGQTSQLATVISTLAIAGLFTPLRRRLQSTIDQRFYRRKYDAEKTLATFSESLRHEVDINSLVEQLQGAIEETMQPSQVSIWLRDAAKTSTRQGLGSVKE